MTGVIREVDSLASIGLTIHPSNRESADQTGYGCQRSPSQSTKRRHRLNRGGRASDRRFWIGQDCRHGQRFRKVKCELRVIIRPGLVFIKAKTKSSHENCPFSGGGHSEFAWLRGSTIKNCWQLFGELAPQFCRFFKVDFGPTHRLSRLSLRLLV